MAAPSRAQSSASRSSSSDMWDTSDSGRRARASNVGHPVRWRSRFAASQRVVSAAVSAKARPASARIGSAVGVHAGRPAASPAVTYDVKNRPDSRGLHKRSCNPTAQCQLRQTDRLDGCQLSYLCLDGSSTVLARSADRPQGMAPGVCGSREAPARHLPMGPDPLGCRGDAGSLHRGIKLYLRYASSRYPTPARDAPVGAPSALQPQSPLRPWNQEYRLSGRMQPMSAADWLHNWASVGIPIVTHC